MAVAGPLATLAPMKKTNVEEFFRRLEAGNPDPRGELHYINPYTLLVAVVLSAQATDVGVNKATRELFKVADNPKAMVALGEADALVGAAGAVVQPEGDVEQQELGAREAEHRPGAGAEEKRAGGDPAEQQRAHQHGEAGAAQRTVGGKQGLEERFFGRGVCVAHGGQL